MLIPNITFYEVALCMKNSGGKLGRYDSVATKLRGSKIHIINFLISLSVNTKGLGS